VKGENGGRKVSCHVEYVFIRLILNLEFHHSETISNKQINE